MRVHAKVLEAEAGRAQTGAAERDVLWRNAASGWAALLRRPEFHRHIRDVEAELGIIEEAITVPALQRELWDLLSICEDMVEQLGGPSDRRGLQNMRDRASPLGDDATPADLRQLIKRAGEFHDDLLRRTDRWEYAVFNTLLEMRDKMFSRARADATIVEGHRAVAAQDHRALAGAGRSRHASGPASRPAEGRPWRLWPARCGHRACSRWYRGLGEGRLRRRALLRGRRADPGRCRPPRPSRRTPGRPGRTHRDLRPDRHRARSPRSGGSVLSLWRALVAARELGAASGKPPTAFTTASADQRDAPHTSATKNRTVTLVSTPGSR